MADSRDSIIGENKHNFQNQAVSARLIDAGRLLVEARSGVTLFGSEKGTAVNATQT
jgi:hypothetical protein